MTNLTNRIRLAGLVPASALLALLALGFFDAPTLRADDENAAQAQQQPQQQQQAPARAVRLSYVDGTVHITLNGQAVTDQAVANTPLFQGMTLTTADDGRAEIQFEDGSVARLSPASALTLKALRGEGANAVAELTLTSGLAYFEIQNSNQSGVIHVKFGDALVTTSGFTVLRVKDDVQPGELAVFSGNAHLARSNGFDIDLHGGESVALSTGALAEAIEPDSWDAWSSDRDQALTAEAANQTGAPAGVGGGDSNNPAWNDLDANGTWYNVPDEGYVWSPYDAAGEDFDPYGNGSWNYSPGYGYIWASAYPWGYLPYQCGAWNFYDNFGWGWAPGIGGCSPWWGSGFYGGPRYGRVPHGYRPVRQPIAPHRPFPNPGRPMPMIAVNRRNRVITAGLPPRDRNSAININGHTVEALRPVHSRQAYEGAFGNRPTAAPGARSFQAPSRPGYTPTPQRGLGFTGSGASSGSHPVPMPQHTYTPQPRSSSGGVSHPSSGGGGFHSSPAPSGGGGFHGGGGGSIGGGGGHAGGGGGGHR